VAELCSCIYCRKEVSNKGIFCHVDRTHLGKTQYSSGNHGKYHLLTERAEERKRLKTIEYNKNPNRCTECNNILDFDSKDSKFCSRSCSAKHNNRTRIESGYSMSLETKKKISEKLSGRTYVERHEISGVCALCGTEFSYIKIGNKARKYCSKSCSSKVSASNRYEKLRHTKTELQNYRRDCEFRFNLKDFPDEFDFGLIEEYGWYKASNRGDNQNGISRDHMVSVRYGFDNNIPPEHISHPANCQLLPHQINIKKNKGCSITYEHLLERIKEWDLKYN